MPTIQQLPVATTVSATDVLPIEQSGTTAQVPLSTLLSGTQATMTLAPGTLVGRISSTSGTPEQVALGTGLAISAGALTVSGVVGPAGPTGPAGPQGVAGPVGSTGAPGATGPTGPQGFCVRSGTAAPAASLGVDGDSYVNTTTGDVYAHAAGVWTRTGNIAGPPGASLRSGTGAPTSSIGNDGDTYINVSTGDVYLRSAGVWSRTGNIAGPASPAITVPSAPLLGGGSGALQSVTVGSGLALSSGALNLALGGMDASAATVLTPTSTTPRTLAARAGDVANVLDFGANPANTTDCAPAFNAAFNALPATGGVIEIPPGSYLLMSPLVWANKPLLVRGAGKGVTTLYFQHTGTGITISIDQGWKKVTLRDFSCRAYSSAGPTAAAVQVSFPTTTASDAEATLALANLEALSASTATASPYGSSFTKGFVLRWCWSARIRDVQFTAAPVIPGLSGTAAFDLGRCEDTWLDQCACYYGDTMVLQSDYGEGIRLHRPTVVGANYLFKQNPATFNTTAVSPYYLVGFYVDGGEVNTYQGGVKAQLLQLGFINATHFSYYPAATASSSYVVFDYTDCVDTTHTGVVAIGNTAVATAIGVRLSYGSLNCSGNAFTCCHFEQFATPALFGVNVFQNIIDFCTCLNPSGSTNALSSAWQDSSGNATNYISWLTSTGSVGYSSPQIVKAASDGKPLLVLDNIKSSANYVQITPATTGNPPTLRFKGTDGTVNATIQSQGGNMYLTASGDGTSGNMLSLYNSSGSKNNLAVHNATAGNGVIITTESSDGETPSLTIGAVAGGALYLTNLPKTNPGAGTGKVWNNNGVVSIA
jgi:hypothetical protein